MDRVALFLCAFALAHGRVYERCELASDLHALGVEPDHIATWVCIAYHESRFDTSAKNPYSGDHGIFQISELFWCGSGKACNIPCSALRDDDIANDFECARQIHEEHTRLQGDGYKAWVVYPHYCKHNTKKYLVDCDLKNVPLSKPRVFEYEERFAFKVPKYVTYNSVDELVPPYLSISNIFRGNYGKFLSQDRVDWRNYKIDYVDTLKLPMVPVKPTPLKAMTTKSPILISTTQTPNIIPPVMPKRVIDRINQLRNKTFFYNKNAPTPAPSEATTTSNLSTSPRPLITNRSNARTIPSETSSITAATTAKPETNTSATTLPTTQRTTARNMASTTTKHMSVTPSHIKTSTTSRSSSNYTPYTTTQKPFENVSDKTTGTTAWPTTRLWRATTPSTATTKWTTASPVSKQWTTFGPITSPKPTDNPTTRRWTTISPPTSQQKQTNIAWYIFPSWTATGAPPDGSSSTAPKPHIKIPTPKPTQSIFDIYLNPTKPQKLVPYVYDSTPNRYNIKIFADGTTTAIPIKQKTEENDDEDDGSRTRNRIKRQKAPMPICHPHE